MIHHTQPTGQKRRIAVIQVPRPQRARMGSIGDGSPGVALAWTTVSDSGPADTSQSWLAFKLMEQARARETTPGSLNYTPASTTPVPNVPPWNSWRNPACQLLPPAPAAVAPKPKEESKLWMLVGLLGAAASVTYLYNNSKGKR